MKSTRSLKLKHSSAMEKEKNLFKCVHHGNTDLALTTAKLLKNMRKRYQCNNASHCAGRCLEILNGNSYHIDALFVGKLQLSSIFDGEPCDMVVKVHFPRSEHNTEKVLTLIRQGIQCLQLSQNTESSGLCWLNDGVSCYYNFVFTPRRVICVTIKFNAYCALIARSVNFLEV